MLLSYTHTQEGKGKLTDVINTEHEHVRYLPGIELPENLRATPDVCETVRDATAIVFCVVRLDQKLSVLAFHEEDLQG